MIKTCIQGGNEHLIQNVCEIYAPAGIKIADVTYGKGIFWRKTNIEKYEFYPSDIKTGVDFRKLPYKNESFDVVVLDPPYAHTPGKKFMTADTYNSQTTEKLTHLDIIDLYDKGIAEAYRILKYGGLLWLKCQDEIESGKQKWSHIELYKAAICLGFYAKDLFVLMQNSTTPVRHKQQHAKKNHSFLWIFQKNKRYMRNE